MSGHYRRVWALALPTLVYNLLEMTLGMTDLYMVRSYGQEASAAMGLIRQITFLVEATAMAIATGVVALVSQGLGKNDDVQVGEAVRQSMLLIFGCSLVISAVGFVASEPLLRLLRATPETIAHGAPYLKVYFITVTFLGVNSVAAAVFRGAKRPMLPLYIAALMCVINVPMNYVFIHGISPIPERGVLGASIGTAIARGFATVVFLSLLLSAPGAIRLRRNATGKLIDLPMIRRMLRVGLPLAIAGFYRNAARVFYLGVVGLSAYGAAFHAAVGVGLQVRLVSVLPALAFQVATATLVGEAIGKRDTEEAANIARRSFLLLAAIMAAVTIVTIVAARPIAAVFLIEREAINLAVPVLQWFAVGQFFSALAINAQGALSGAGDTRPVMRYTLISQWGVLLVLAYVLLRAGWDPMGPLVAWAVAPVVMLVQVLLRWRAGHWRTTKV